MLDLAAKERLPAIVLFPSLRTEGELVEQLRVLETGERWTLSRERVEGLVTDDVLIGLQWKTSSGLIPQPMGFGPFPTMPVTRRAPYICLATWPGEHENVHRKKFEPQMVDFLDSRLPEPLTAGEYKAVWNGSTNRTTELLSEALRQVCPLGDAGQRGILSKRRIPAERCGGQQVLTRAVCPAWAIGGSTPGRCRCRCRAERGE